MYDRTKTFYYLILLAAVILTAGCGYNQQSKFQMSFLPPAPHPAADTDAGTLPPAPAVQPNPYLQQQPPAFILVASQPPARKTAGDQLVMRAEQTFQQGKRSYQTNDIPNARRLFDSAIDLMLEASDENPADRQDYDRRLEDMTEAIHRFDLAGMGASAEIEQGKFEKAPLEDILEMTFPVDPKLKDRVREQVSATVSQLPLTVNDTVLGYINYFSHRGHGTIVAATQRSGKYRPMIQRILDEEGVPQELIHLAQAESGFIPRAMSRKAAGGMWQFLVSRGQQYGLMQTRFTDERMDPEKATRAAARHLRDLYSEFGDWYLAIAAYNCGPGVVEKAVERTGSADFWELRSTGVLPKETTNYVPIILAMTIMEKNAAEYDLQGIQLEPSLEYDTVELNAPTSLALVSDITDTPLPELATLNPAVLRTIAPESYSLHVPKGAAKQLVAVLQMVPTERRAAWRLHRVASGETLASIGKRYGIAPNAIVAANSLEADEALEGDRLLIPSVVRPETPAAPSVRRPVSRSAVAAHARARSRNGAASAKSAGAKSATSTTSSKKKQETLAARARG
jgi:membrane-bound lytic murein transglycosylase D